MVHQESKKNWVITGLLLGILMSSMDNTIVAAAMGTIVSELGGLDQFIWVTSAYMIASVAGMPIFGKLSDMYGRKLFYLLGLSLFIIGSILCGMAQSMTQLSIYRAIQGIGGGALMPIAFTIIFDIFPPQERGKINGLFGAVFGLSSVFGPLLGAYFTDYIHWRWVFYINIPLGLISLAFIYKFYKESLEHREQKIDWWGAILLVIAIVSLMFALEFGGKEYTWDSAVIMSLFASFVVFFAVFLWVETKASDPIINLSLFKNRLFATTQGIGLFYGAVFILATMYLPIFVQGVFGGAATNAGLILIPLMLGVVAGSQIGGRTINLAPYRNIMLGSGFFLFIGMYLLGTISPDTSRWLVTVYMILAGMGVGVSFPVLSMSAVHGLEMHQRGAATSAVAFFRVIGMTLGISVFGTIQNRLLTDKLRETLPAFDQFAKQGIDSRALLQPEVRAHIPEPILSKMTDALASSIATIFQWSLVSAGIALVCIFVMGNARLEALKQMSNKR
jgi:EmrB/QacA subfamily drug resistance transporter